MLSKILDIIKSLIDFFLNKKDKEKLEVINKIEEKKEIVEFQSEVEKVVKRASSEDEIEKQKAIDDMRKLVSQ